ncbi:hypothetical protein Tsp_10285, partial [Trichinella spiralis]|uniref:hypothetical protein n=1 Tax=Trichinella spiralis TaxID=6334 RepID=UPI0001EFE1BD
AIYTKPTVLYAMKLAITMLIITINIYHKQKVEICEKYFWLFFEKQRRQKNAI